MGRHGRVSSLSYMGGRMHFMVFGVLLTNRMTLKYRSLMPHYRMV